MSLCVSSWIWQEKNMALRLKVEEGIKEANKNFVIAKAGMSEQTLNTALMAPKQEVYLDAGKKKCHEC